MRGDGSLETGDTNYINNYHVGHKRIYMNIISAHAGYFWCKCNFVIYGSTILSMPHVTTLMGLET
jgi:hypothetical protein